MCESPAAAARTKTRPARSELKHAWERVELPVAQAVAAMFALRLVALSALLVAAGGARAGPIAHAVNLTLYT